MIVYRIYDPQEDSHHFFPTRTDARTAKEAWLTQESKGADKNRRLEMKIERIQIDSKRDLLILLNDLGSSTG